RFTRACTLALTVLGTPAATASTRLASTVLTATATTTLTVGATKAFGLFGVESFAGSLRFRQTTLGILGNVQVLIQVWGRRIGFSWLALRHSYRVGDPVPPWHIFPLDQGHSYARMPSTSSPTDTVQVSVFVCGGLEVEHAGDVFHVDATGCNIGCQKY